MLQNDLNDIIQNAESMIANVKSTNELLEVKSKFTGKNGQITQLMKHMKDFASEDRPKFGKIINEARTKIEDIISKKQAELKQDEINKKLSNEMIDITLDKEIVKQGALHPTTLVINEVLDIFTSLGFSIKDGPEIETDMFNFQLLNIPKDHPARDMQDTFYFTEDLLLRTQTSPIQARTMLKQNPPIKIVTPGKVYRPDNDASHSPMFQQIEGLVVDKKVTLCDLQGLLLEFAKRLFDDKTKVRFRPSYFPFTEPSVEVDVTCAVCHGKGCSVCKSTGWLEILGAGVVNPVVLENCGIDSKKYKGLAFGMGVERIAMIKYGIPDIRLMFQNDKRFLNQFVNRGE